MKFLTLAAGKALIMAMNNKFFYLFLLILVSNVYAEEQTVSVDAQIDSSFASWLFNESTKHDVIGMFVTITTVIIGIVLYYVFKTVY